MNNESIPAEELERIETDANEAAMGRLWSQRDHFLSGYRKGAAAEYLRHASKAAIGLRWVKASEMMPDHKHFLPIKIIDGKVPMHSIGHVTIDGMFWDDWHDNAYPPDQIEWLDESIPSAEPK